jgi:hypothetical protein
VHHRSELGFGGDDATHNYLPVPLWLHDAVSAMWRALRRIPEVHAALARAREGQEVDAAEL